jgi:murein DD-endopeptidase MepM/ murein hydrolase activator NlpD
VLAPPRRSTVRRPRTAASRRSTTIVTLVVALLLAIPAAAWAFKPAPSNLPQTPKVDVTAQIVDLTFPVAAHHDGVRFSDDFLHLRGGGTRLHAATDVMAPKHRPVHAAVGGTITYAPVTEPSWGWMLTIAGDDGRRYSYIHLNNDTPRRDANGRWLDDDRGGIDHAYSPRIVAAIRTTGTAQGLRVARGEHIGFVGDSGNAKGIAPHLHLEIHVSSTVHGDHRINPYHSLVAALERGDVPGARRFRDVSPDTTHAAAIERLAEAGVVSGCTADRYCPGLPVTRGDLAAYVAAAKGLATVGPARFPDVDATDPNAGAIAAVDAAGILTGYVDGTFGPDDPFTRQQLASMLVRAFDVPAVSTPAPFEDVIPGRTHAAEIAAIHAAGVTRGCGDGTRYCGGDPVRRDQIASFLDRALRGAW